LASCVAALHTTLEELPNQHLTAASIAGESQSLGQLLRKLAL